MNKNVKNIIKIILFIIIFIIIFVCLSYYKKVQYIDQLNVAGFYGEKDNTLDVIYIGGSACFVYYQSLTAFEKYGIASYTFGTNTIQMELYEYMTKEALKTQKPKLLIIDARAFEYRDTTQKPTEVSYRNLLTAMPLNMNKIKFINEYVPKLSEENNRNKYSYLFDLLFYHSSINQTNIKTSFDIMLGNYKNVNKGFFFVPKVESQNKINFEKTFEIKKMTDESYDIFIRYLDYLKSLNNIKVLFAVSPYIETQEQKKTFNYVESVIKEYDFDFVDFNDYTKEMQIDYKTDFYNDNHVNIFGSDKYTDYLSKYIIEKYEIPNRKNDENYNSWNELLPNWNKNVNNCKNTINGIIKGGI